MAGDKVDEKQKKVDSDNKSLDSYLYSNLEDEGVNISCPEFQFSTAACYICNGYYGPCFEEPVCATCHAFIFPDEIGIPPAPIFSQKSDDEDSGNDEPTDLYYNIEKKMNQRQREDQQERAAAAAAKKNLENENNLPNSSQEEYRWENGKKVEPPKLRNLAERVELLSNHKHIEHEPVNETGLVERLPPEVLLVVFSHLDDVSLWSAANVCRRWNGLLLTHVPSQQWQQQVKLRWPLYKAIGHVDNWYKIYDRLASSMPCRTCLSQMCLRSKPACMIENSWRRNRLRMELKNLRMDPPEGIEATPLDSMCCHWQATITGPIGSPYEGGLFYLYLQVPDSYPMCPPVVRFLTKIIHPNVSRHGDVGIDSIHHNWSLALTISKVLISVQSLLTDPYCQVCMEPELGDMYLNNREQFDEIARAWTWKYAMHDVVTSG